MLWPGLGNVKQSLRALWKELGDGVPRIAGGDYLGNSRTATTLSPMNFTKIVLAGGWP